MFLLEQNIFKKNPINKIVTFIFNLKIKKNEKYKVNKISNSIIYIKMLKNIY